jgi:beta-1,4-mannosyl-glycoprotein beta-1,4-N-acetylglucosaminyltransferase
MRSKFKKLLINFLGIEVFAYIYKFKNLIFPFDWIKFHLPFSIKEIPYIPSLFKDKKNLSTDTLVIDCFSFFNELDLLEIRLEILSPFVDLFVLTESRIMFNGESKPLYFDQNKKRYEKFLYKIKHVILDDLPINRKDLLLGGKFNNSNTASKIIELSTLINSILPENYPPNYLAEYYFKENLQVTLSELNLPSDTVIFISDLDEIWNPNARFKLKNRVYLFKLRSYCYFLNVESNERYHSWTGSICIKYSKLIKVGVNKARQHNGILRYLVYNGGWHFTAMGGVDSVKEKIKAFLDEDFLDTQGRETIESKVLNLQELRGRRIRFKVVNHNLPKYLIANESKYKSMFRIIK